MAFEKFTGRCRGFNEPRVSISKNGTMLINCKCHEKYFARKGYAHFYYDRETKRIGIEPVNEKTGSSYALRKTKRGTTFFLTAIAFLKSFGIMQKRTQSYIAIWDERRQMIIINLKEPVIK